MACQVGLKVWVSLKMSVLQQLILAFVVFNLMVFFTWQGILTTHALSSLAATHSTLPPTCE